MKTAKQLDAEIAEYQVGDPVWFNRHPGTVTGIDRGLLEVRMPHGAGSIDLKDTQSVQHCRGDSAATVG